MNEAMIPRQIKPPLVEPHINVRSLAMRFCARGETVVALENVNTHVKRHEFVSFLGPSGCGKSTLLMVIAGLLKPSAGEVRIDGRLITQPITNAGIVFQQDLLFDWRTILDNVLLQAQVRRMDMTAAEARARDLLKQVGLGGFEERRPWELSGGMRQRVAICRALLHNADILLLDEPFGALDALTRDQMNVDLQEMWARNRQTAILVTHSISEAIFLSDRVVVVSPRPGTVSLDLPIDFPRPRRIDIRESPEFLDYQKTLRRSIGIR